MDAFLKRVYITEIIPETTNLNTAGGGIMFLRNVGISLQVNTVPQPSRKQSDQSPP
jgi:hypothetical protein